MVNATLRPLYPQKKTEFRLHRRLGGPQGRSGLFRQMLPSPEFDLRTIRPIASRYEWCLSCTLHMLAWCECPYQYKLRPTSWPLRSTNCNRHELCVCAVGLVRQWDSCVKGHEQWDIVSTYSSLLCIVILVPLLSLSRSRFLNNSEETASGYGPSY